MTGSDAFDPWAKHRSGPIIVQAMQWRDIPDGLLGSESPFADYIDERGHWRATLRIEWAGTADEFEQYERERSAA